MLVVESATRPVRRCRGPPCPRQLLPTSGSRASPEHRSWEAQVDGSVPTPTMLQPAWKRLHATWAGIVRGLNPRPGHLWLVHECDEPAVHRDDDVARPGQLAPGRRPPDSRVPGGAPLPDGLQHQAQARLLADGVDHVDPPEVLVLRPPQGHLGVNPRLQSSGCRDGCRATWAFRRARRVAATRFDSSLRRKWSTSSCKTDSE
jgi:hypothetical protein